MDELTAELKNGKSAAENVVRHLRDMGAAKATIPVEVDGVAYVVCAHEATLQDPRDPRIAALEGELSALRAQLAAPLRLGRGPTVEESDAHGDGRWIVWLNIVAGSQTCQDGGEFICEVPADFVVRYRSQIRDCIPLSSSRQPCGVGDK